MFNKRISFLLIVILCTSLITACNKKQEIKVEKTLPIAIIQEYSHNKLKYSDTTTLVIEENDSIISCTYVVEFINDSSYSISDIYQFPANDSSIIYFFDEPSYLVSQKTYTLNNQPIVVYKYLYDEENSMDEEAYLYVHNKRAIALNTIAWNLQRFYIYENSDMSNLLKSDSSNFFYFWK